MVQSSRHREKGGDEMEKWEYMTIVANRREELEQQLNKLGAEGWEAVSVQYIYAEPKRNLTFHGHREAILKRRAA
jgi:hypothetical protein